MLFDVYSQNDTVRGELTAQIGNTLVYADTHVKNENTDEVTMLEKGHSYQVVVEDQEAVTLQFETSHGAGDGISEEVLLHVLLNKAKAMELSEHSEERSLYIRALQMAVDALNAANGLMIV